MYYYLSCTRPSIYTYTSVEQLMCSAAVMCALVRQMLPTFWPACMQHTLLDPVSMLLPWHTPGAGENGT